MAMKLLPLALLGSCVVLCMPLCANAEEVAPPAPVDVCVNIEGAQDELPIGMAMIDEMCEPILRVSGMTVVPASMIVGQSKLPVVSVRSTRVAEVKLVALKAVRGYVVAGRCQVRKPLHPANPPRCPALAQLRIVHLDLVDAGLNQLKPPRGFWRQLTPGRYRLEVRASDHGEVSVARHPLIVKPRPVAKPPTSPPSDQPPLQPVGPEDVDCSDIGHPVTVLPGDPDRLDADGDGIGCENS
jgi:hypothetical protein